MSNRTTVVLAAVALGLMAFIVFFERHTLSSGELAKRQEHLLHRFVRDKVSQIEIQHGKDHIVLVRLSGTDEDMLTAWKLTSPVKSKADDDAVESLLGSMQWADARRELDGVSNEDRARFGLTHPALRASFTVAGQRVPIVMGKQDPTGTGYYVQLDDSTKVYVVGKDLYEALDQDASHFRGKALFPDHDPEDVKAFSAEGQGGARKLAKRDDGWWVTAPFEAHANKSLAEAAVDGAIGMKATRFIDDHPKNLSKWGLDAPVLKVRVEGTEPPDTSGASSKHEHKRVPFAAELAIGGACAGHQGELYARPDDGPVVCVKSSDVDPLRKDAAALRETQLATVSDSDLKGAEVTRGGATLKLASKDDKWTWRLGASKGKADSTAVTDWLKRLRETTALEFQPLTADVASRFGLDHPRATLALDGDGGRRTVLYLGGKAANGVWVRRGDEPFALRVPAETVKEFDAAPVVFRERTLITEKDGAATRIVIQRGAVTERLLKGKDGAWKVTEPVSAAADKVLTEELVRNLASLQAVRFVAASSSPEQGLGSPRWVVTVRFEGKLPDQKDKDKAPAPREDVLRIGAQAPGGAYAQLGSDPAVFVVPQDMVDAIGQSLVSRDLLATDAQDVAALEITRGAKTVALTCSEGTCSQKGGAPADTDLTRKLLNRLAGLRATDTTGYGPAPKSAGLAKPRAKVTVTRTDGGKPPAHYTFLIGATEGQGDAAQTHVRIEGLDVGFVFPAYVMDGFASYQP